MKIEQLISVDEKKHFLKWFISRYELKAKECIWLLNYILSDDHLISLLRFVQSIEKCPRAMFISERCTKSVPFLYRKERVETNEPEKAFHDIRLYQDDPIYLQLDFVGVAQSAPYLSVLEDHPFAASDLEERYGKEADQFMHHSEKAFLLEKLNLQIDQALKEKDEGRFRALTNQLIDLQNKMKEESER